jgi:hypothetical protein
VEWRVTREHPFFLKENGDEFKAALYTCTKFAPDFGACRIAAISRDH